MEKSAKAKIARVENVMENLKSQNSHVEVMVGDITQLSVDAIVNAANHSLLGGGGVDGAIHHAAGSELLEATRKLGGCETGEAKITPGFKLPAKWTIHTVGPVWKGGSQNEKQLLENAYRNSLELAIQHNVKSIAFPLISTGAYGYPKEEAAQIAVTVMQQYVDRFDQMIVCAYSAEDAAIYRELLGE